MLRSHLTQHYTGVGRLDKLLGDLVANAIFTDMSILRCSVGFDSVSVCHSHFDEGSSAQVTFALDFETQERAHKYYETSC